MEYARGEAHLQVKSDTLEPYTKKERGRTEVPLLFPIDHSESEVPLLKYLLIIHTNINYIYPH